MFHRKLVFKLKSDASCVYFICVRKKQNKRETSSVKRERFSSPRLLPHAVEGTRRDGVCVEVVSENRHSCLQRVHLATAFQSCTWREDRPAVLQPVTTCAQRSLPEGLGLMLSDAPPGTPLSRRPAAGSFLYLFTFRRFFLL